MDKLDCSQAYLQFAFAWLARMVLQVQLDRNVRAAQVLRIRKMSTGKLVLDCYIAVVVSVTWFQMPVSRSRIVGSQSQLPDAKIVGSLRGKSIG